MSVGRAMRVLVTGSSDSGMPGRWDEGAGMCSRHAPRCTQEQCPSGECAPDPSGSSAPGTGAAGMRADASGGSVPATHARQMQAGARSQRRAPADVIFVIPHIQRLGFLFLLGHAPTPEPSPGHNSQEITLTRNNTHKR